MKKITIKNIQFNNEGSLLSNDENETSNWIYDISIKESFGKSARWLWLDQATAFELSREDDRREIEVQPEIPEYIDEDNIFHDATPAVYRTEIHVPDDFTITITDITTQYNYEQKKQALDKKNDAAYDVFLHMDTMFDALPVESIIAILARADIQQIIFYLRTLGSLEYTKAMVDALPTDANITQEMVTDISNYIQGKLDGLH